MCCARKSFVVQVDGEEVAGCWLLAAGRVVGRTPKPGVRYCIGLDPGRVQSPASPASPAGVARQCRAMAWPGRALKRSLDMNTFRSSSWALTGPGHRRVRSVLCARCGVTRPSSTAGPNPSRPSSTLQPCALSSSQHRNAGRVPQGESCFRHTTLADLDTGLLTMATRMRASTHAQHIAFSLPPRT